ncbi:hypothetical protein EVAR_64332_1 [Eumeta japonica]|uniref:Uncharacterized protein n=1 Tax=Eumeta variegata TaxID=151549 RepID=A0A4C1ZCY0_EUMVA|nr:hypothetical protein EVAR_64332_1 [Eumeta japonica]
MTHCHVAPEPSAHASRGAEQAIERHDRSKHLACEASISILLHRLMEWKRDVESERVLRENDCSHEDSGRCPALSAGLSHVRPLFTGIEITF